MNVRKVLLIIGGVIVLLVAAMFAVALFTIQKMESDKNRARTQKARERRWENRQEPEVSNLTVTSDGIEPKQEDNATGESETPDEKKD